MSYTFGNTGGTTYGLKSYNEIFALNRTTVGASNYWNPTLADFDTVICSDNSKLLTYYNGYWWGTGIYLCLNNSGSTRNPGDYVGASETAASSGTNSRPVIYNITSSGDRERAFGVCLTTAANQGLLTVAINGLWPVKRSGTPSTYISVHPATSNNQVLATTSPGGGRCGKLIDLDFGIIDSTDAVPDVAAGCKVMFYGTANETY